MVVIWRSFPGLLPESSWRACCSPSRSCIRREYFALLHHHVGAIVARAILVRGRVVVLGQVEATQRALVRDLVTGVGPVFELVLDQLGREVRRRVGVVFPPCAVCVLPEVVTRVDALGLVDEHRVLPALPAIDRVRPGHLDEDRIGLVIPPVGEAADLAPIEALPLLVPDHPLRDLHRLGVVPLMPAAKTHAQPLVGARAEAANRPSLRLLPDEMRSKDNGTRHADLPRTLCPIAGRAYCPPAQRQ